MNDDTRQKLGKFFDDPDWALVVGMINEQIEPLRDIMSIDTTRSNDEIASELRGRQISIKGMEKFLHSSGIIKSKTTTKTTFK